MTDHPNFNYPLFDMAAKDLRSRDWIVFSPAEHAREMGFDETLNSLAGFNQEQQMAWCLGAIRQADCFALLPGWETSAGCLQEFDLAHALGKPIFTLTFSLQHLSA